jgi:hypothetical protein
MGFSLGSLLKTVAPIALAAMTGGASLAVTLQQMAVRAVVQMAIQKIGQELGLPPAIINMAQSLAAGQTGGPSLNDFSKAGGPANFLAQAFQEFSAADQGNINRTIDKFSSEASIFAGKLEQAINKQTAKYESAFAELQQARASGASEKEITKLTATADKAQSEMTRLDELFTGMNLANSRRKSAAAMKDVMNGKGSLLMKIAILLGMIADQKMSDMATKAEQIGKMGEIKGTNQAKFTQMNSELQALGQELGTISQATANVIKSIGEAGATLARKG